jgi:uncharacterized protein
MADMSSQQRASYPASAAEVALSPPSTLADRVVAIDAVRAIALLGVLVMNFRDISGLSLLSPGVLAAVQTPVDAALGAILAVLVDWKALSAFSLLFGISFSLILESCRRRGIPPVPFYLRRLAVLSLFGALNVAVFFWGDILITYAIVGLILLPATRLSQRAALITSLIVLVGTPLLLAMLGQPRTLLSVPMTDFAALLSFGQASFWVTVAHNIELYTNAAGAGSAIGVWRYCTIGGLFLLGLWAGRARILQEIPKNRHLLRRVASIAIPVGLMLATAEYLVPDTSPWSMALLVGTPILAIGYVAAIALFLDSERGARLRTVLAPAGQMALTLYLLGGLLGEAVFYGWGLGLLASVGDVAVLAITVGIYALLAAASHGWLRRFRYGPFEWAWRCLSHMAFQPIRR